MLYKKQALPEKSRFPAVIDGGRLRYITPIEAERLQGFPDGWTDVPYRGKPAADGPRMKAIGNSMATHCMHWIGKRIAMALGQLPALHLVPNDATTEAEPQPEEHGVSEARTAADIRAQMMAHIRGMVEYWAAVPGLSVEDRCDGVAFSVLTMLDGATDVPACLLVSSEGPVLNEDCELHEEYAALVRDKAGPAA